MCKERQEAGDLHIPGFYTLLFPWQERKIPGEEENQQEEICEEMQRNQSSDSGHEDKTSESHHKETE